MKGKRARRRGSLLAGAALTVVVCLFATAILAAPTAASPMDGRGMWVWYVSASGGTGKAIARKADRRDLDVVFVKSGDGGSYWSQFDSALVHRLHDRGIEACAWQFVYGNSPGAEARIGARAVREGADCLIIDAEGDYEGKYAAADKYVHKLRRRVGQGYPIGLSSFPYVDYHPAFPYSVFLGRGGAQRNLPQVYWHTIGDRVGSAFAHTFKHNLPYARPIAPVGQTYDSPPKRELVEFRRYANEYRSEGESWWSWQETSASEWRRVSRRVRHGVPGVDAENHTGLEHGSAGDLVVLAQELLLAHRLDVRVSGTYHRSTVIAVEAFQEAQGLPVTGRIGDRTWTELLERRPVRIRWGRDRHDRARPAPARPASASLAPTRDEIPPARLRR